MQRITISIDDDICSEFDELIKKRGYSNRSEAFRDLARREIASDRLLEDKGDCVGVVSYLYDHHKMQLSSRMVDLQHSHGSLVVTSLHVHVSHADCVEAVVLRGPAGELKEFADALIAERGIEHGVANIIPVFHAGDEHPHDHGYGHPHFHDKGER